MARTITCPSCSAALSLPDRPTAALTCPRCLARVEPPAETITTAPPVPMPELAPLESTRCSKCGAGIQPEYRFCPHCQTRVPQPGEAPPEDAKEIWWTEPGA